MNINEPLRYKLNLQVLYQGRSVFKIYMAVGMVDLIQNSDDCYMQVENQRISTPTIDVISKFPAKNTIKLYVKL